MATHGGGWTLVYSYTFTNYSSFDSDSNAVTPRPNWPTPHTNVPVSTTPPLSESSLGAVDWNLWKDIVKSTINDWIVCQPNDGSIVVKKQGSIICEHIKNVAPACGGVVPDDLKWHGTGPILGLYYRFEGTKDHLRPIHDPCGKRNADNYKKEIANPGEQIYLR